MAGARGIHEYPKQYFAELLSRGVSEVVEIDKILERQRAGLEPLAPRLLTRVEAEKQYSK